ncbi:BEN domain-containing protein 3 isoform X1 [Sardina pilchardus]|uniref:BEN domain-containing protein 3 isoform X1 n=2 Tax=Sardina pilchardus TaxID=27697 RepID=UPI002E11EA1B
MHGVMHDMNVIKHEDNVEREMLEKGGKTSKEIKTEEDSEILQGCHGTSETAVGKSLGAALDGISTCSEAQQDSEDMSINTDQPISRKRVKLASEVGEHVQEKGCEESTMSPLHSLTSDKKDAAQEKTIASYRKPLYSISHRITEKKAASSLDQHGQHEAGVRLNSILLPKLCSSGPNNRCESSLTQGGSAAATPTDPNLYPLIEKMFFILNTLNTSMTQLHSKVDLLSLEVTRIKKQIKPSEMAMEFQPPPEYQLTSEELAQLMEQTSTAGELGCRLLVQLFPELFTAKDGSHGCGACGIAGKRTLDSLHLQLIRNYVEVCYPLVKNSNVWQTECLLQINDFFNRFWAQKDMENGQPHGKQTPVGLGFEVDQSQPCHFINEDGQDERLSVSSDNSNGPLNISSDLILDSQEVGEELDDLSSPDDFVILLLNRLFPEIFEEGKLPEGYSGCNSIGKLLLDSDRLEIIRKYMEANFPDMPEDTWLQICIQRMEEALEAIPGNGNDLDNMQDESFDTNLPDDISIVKISEFGDFDRPNRRTKKSWLAPMDFDTLEMPLPDFDVPQEYLLTKEQLKNNYDCSLSIGNFASRLLVLMFPELFTYENARKHYNCSGTLGKKQLDPIRIRLIRHYVQLLYPRAKNDRVWTLEFVDKLDERCRRRDTEQRRSYQQQRKVFVPKSEQEFVTASQISQLTSERLKEDYEMPPVPPEKSSKDFCKIPLEELAVPPPDFPVPSVYLLSDSEVREIVQQSLSVGNFAARLLVRLFPELFTQENLRLQYNHSGACNKKQLDPVRLRLIRHYVEAVYPVDKMEEVWHYECVPSIDERCRRPNRKKCDILKKAKRSSTVSYS